MSSEACGAPAVSSAPAPRQAKVSANVFRSESDGGGGRRPPRREGRWSLDRSLVANHALQPLADHAGSTGVGQHPWSDLPRRLVAHVLGVAALEVGHPVAFGVLVKPRDSSPHLLSG
jgi:hypothetical protein